MDFLLKKASIVTLGLAVAITPAVSVAAEENSENVEQQAVVGTDSEQTTTESVDVVVPDATTDGSTDSEAVADEPTTNEESEAPTEEVPVEEAPAEEAPTAEEPAATEDEVTEENTENTEEVEAEAPNEEEVVTPPTEDGSTPNDEEVVDENEEEQPELTYEEIVAQMNGSVTGKVSEYDKEKGYYTLTINASVTNNSEQAITNFYTGVDIPDNIMVLDTDETPQDIYLLTGEETELAIPVGEVKAGETKNISISIPVIGKTSGANLLQDLNGYVIDEEGYLPVGSISGTSNLTFSTMTEATFFEGKAQAVTDFPGLADNQFGMQFGFKVQNLQIENIDNVKIEFIVPDGVTIHEPDSYKEGEIPDALDDFLDGGDLGLGSSRLDLDWNGNTASVNIGAIEAASGYQGFFSAIGESNLSFEDIKKLQVKITLFSGNEEIESYTTPIELVKYQGNEEEPGNKPGNGTDNGSNPDKDNDGGTTPTPIVNKPTPNNSGKGNNPSDNNSNNGGQVKGNNDSNIKVIPVANNNSKNEQGGQLPKTAGTNPVGALMGGAIAALGAAILAVRKRLFQ